MCKLNKNVKFLNFCLKNRHLCALFDIRFSDSEIKLEKRITLWLENNERNRIEARIKQEYPKIENVSFAYIEGKGFRLGSLGIVAILKPNNSNNGKSSLKSKSVGIKHKHLYVLTT